MRALAIVMAAVTMAWSASASAAPCYDLSKGEPHALSGTLDYVVYPGPPNFEDVQKGDTPEPNYVLRLAGAICLKGDEFADPKSMFRSVQVVETATAHGQLKRYLRKAVTLTLTQQIAAETGHHHEPLVAWVTAVAAAGRPMDFTDEYGTAATTIRAFYAALADGQGGPASAMIVPEKRRLPAFSPSGLSKFWGGLSKPVRLIDIAQTGPGGYVVHYRYSTTSRTCHGSAAVTTVARAGRNYIQGIRPLNGC